jgi:hypothetical protein
MVVMFPSGGAHSGYLSLFLHMIPESAEERKLKLRTEFRFRLKHANAGLELPSELQKGSFPNIRDNGEVAGWGTLSVISLDQLKAFITDQDELTIDVEITIINTKLQNTETPPLFTSHNNSQLQKELESLTNSETTLHSDMTLRVQGQDIPVHKAILALRSPVFRAMFDHEMREMKDSVVEIDDFDKNSVRAIVNFMYTDRPPICNADPERKGRTITTPVTKPPNAVEKKDPRQTMAALGSMLESKTDMHATVKSWEDSVNVFKAADKYHLDRLAQLCVPMVILYLTLDNAIPTLQLAAKHLHSSGGHALKKATMNWCLTHAEELITKCALQHCGED